VGSERELCGIDVKEKIAEEKAEEAVCEGELKLMKEGQTNV